MALTVLFLHGVGQGVRADAWLDGLNDGLRGLGQDPLELESVQVVVPDYVDLLTGATPAKVKEPTATGFPPRKADDGWDALVTEYSRRQRRLGDLMPPGPPAAGLGRLGQRVADWGAWMTPPVGSLEDAARYAKTPALRHAVLQRVLSMLSQHRDLLVIGHSLGSLVAIDLLAHLPLQARVRRLVTIGSPAGLMPMHKSTPSRLLERFPYHQVESWVNILSPWDAVTGGRGLAYLFPAAVDVRVSLPWLEHGADAYLRHPAAAGAVVDAWREEEDEGILAAGTELEVRTSAEEEAVLAGLTYAHLVAARVKDKKTRQRYRTALADVQGRVARELAQQRVAQGSPIPPALRDLEGGRPPSGLVIPDLEVAILSTVVAATTNQVAPYDIDVSAADVEAVPDFWRALGLGDSGGEHVRDALKAAAGEFETKNWGRFALGAVGLALVAAGPLGLVLVAPAGLAGAAAITASLAAFGPGGMIGGMVLAGGLVGSGSVTAAAAVMVREVSSQTMGTEVVRRMAISLSRARLGLPEDSTSWLMFVEIESYLATEVAMLSTLSDERSPTMRDLRRKEKIIRKAIAWMVDHGLAPTLGRAPAEAGTTPLSS